MVAACPFPARRGTPLRIERLAEALVERGQHVDVVTYDLAEEVYPLAFEVHRPSGAPKRGTILPGPTPAKLALYDPALARLLRRLLRERSYDVIHAHHFEGVLVADWARKGTRIPLVYDAHTMLSSELPSYRFGLPKSLIKAVGGWLDRCVPSLADHIVTVTPDIRDRLVAEFGQAAERVTVAMNGVEASRFDVIGADSPPPNRVIYCGTMAKYQGIELLLRAFASARRIRPALELLFVVRESFEPYEKLARELGIRSAITFEADSLELLPERLAGAAIAVLPRPVCDGIPQKLLNYMAAARPVVSFAGSAKVLIHEETGLVVENGDIDGFAGAMVRLAEDPALARRMGNQARRFVVDHCSWDSAARRCEGVYNALLANPGTVKPR